MIGAFALVLAAVSAAQAPADRPIVITDVDVIPMDREHVIPHQSVLIERG